MSQYGPGDPPVGHPRLVKLVRDHIAELVPDSTVTYRKIDDKEQLRAMLRAKLLEEMAEYLRGPSLGELADIYEAVMALCVIDLGESTLDLMEEAASKRAERGGFMGGMGMWITPDELPVVMRRGITPTWTLYDGDGRPLHIFHARGTGEELDAIAREWTNANGYYLSSHSDADDRNA